MKMNVKVVARFIGFAHGPQQTWAENWGELCPHFGGGSWVPI